METNYSDKTTHIRCDSHSPSENNTALPSDRETAQLSAGNNSRPGDHSHGCLDIELNWRLGKSNFRLTSCPHVQVQTLVLGNCRLKWIALCFAFAGRALGEKPTPGVFKQILTLGVAAQCLLHGICPEISGKMQLIQLWGEEHEPQVHCIDWDTAAWPCRNEDLNRHSISNKTQLEALSAALRRCPALFKPCLCPVTAGWLFQCTEPSPTSAPAGSPSPKVLWSFLWRLRKGEPRQLRPWECPFVWIQPPTFWLLLQHCHCSPRTRMRCQCTCWLLFLLINP